MDDKTKKIIFSVGSLFAALIFITSYAAFGNNTAANSSTTSIGSANTVFVYGSANGVIVNYSYTAYISAPNDKLAALNSTLGTLEANGSISNYVAVNSTTYQAILSTINPYQLYTYLSSALNSSNVSVDGYAYVTLPSTITMYYSTGLQVPISFPQKNYSVPLTKTYPIGSNVPLKVQVLVTTNGKIYNNQIRLSEG